MNGPRFQSPQRRRRVAPSRKCRVRSEGADGALEAHDAVRVRLRGAAIGHDRVDEVRMGNGPLERLLRTHREADDRAQVPNAQRVQDASRGLDVIALGDGREVRSRQRRRRVARRRGEAVREHLGGHQEVPIRIERATRADQKVVAVIVRAVPGRDQDGVVARVIQPAECRVADLCHRQDTAAFEFEIRQPEKLPMGIGHCRRSLGSQEYAGTEQRQGDSKR